MDLEQNLISADFSTPPPAYLTRDHPFVLPSHPHTYANHHLWLIVCANVAMPPKPQTTIFQGALLGCPNYKRSPLRSFFSLYPRNGLLLLLWSSKGQVLYIIIRHYHKASYREAVSLFVFKGILLSSSLFHTSLFVEWRMRIFTVSSNQILFSGSANPIHIYSINGVLRGSSSFLYTTKQTYLHWYPHWGGLTGRCCLSIVRVGTF